MTMAEPWFDELAFGIGFGAIGGSVLGSMGALIGTAAGILVPRGRGRAWLLPLTPCTALLGLASLVLGLVALVAGQPYAIWYPPTLGGASGAFVFGTGIWVLRARYAEVERRRLDAEGLRHS